MEIKNFQQFLVSVLVIVVYPLIPIVCEFFTHGKCLSTTLTLTAAVYSITVLSSSQKLVLLFFSFIPTLIFGIIYAILSKEEAVQTGTQPPALNTLNVMPYKVSAIIALIAIAITHSLERYKRHVTNSEPFLQRFQ